MPRSLIVVNRPDRWPLQLPDVEIVSSNQYLTDPQFLNMRNVRVFNLARSYRYQNLGYYVSLLAEARGHKPIPSVATLQDLKYQSLVKVVSSDLDELIEKSLAPIHSNEFVLSIYFARNLAKRYDQLARQLFNLFPVPLLRAKFKKDEDGVWGLQSLSPIAANEIPKGHLDSVVEFAKEYFTKGKTPKPSRKQPRFQMAMLTGDATDDPTPPSDEKALEKFIDAAERLDISVDVIDREDYGTLGEFDALFIRKTTAVNDITYRFARKAEAEGLVVIDDPTSILRCTNKVYLAELLNRHGIRAPKTTIIQKENAEAVLEQLGLPCVLKQPDSAFSQGVVKVDTPEEYHDWVNRLLDKSDMLIGQEFVRTDFDWRVGIIDQKPLYACKYFMARGHWQIYNHAERTKDPDTDDFTGEFECMPVELAPAKVVSTAVKAAALIGDSLYGVDLKTIGNKTYVIEVNDNPSIDSGVEDSILKNTLYDRVMESFLRRLERQDRR